MVPSPTSCATSSASKARCAGRRPSTSSLATLPLASACAQRGLLREGYWADLVVFDPAAIGECADFADPYRYPQGIDCVIVNGRIAVERGEIADSRAGQIVRA